MVPLSASVRITDTQQIFFIVDYLIQQNIVSVLY